MVLFVVVLRLGIVLMILVGMLVFLIRLYSVRVERGVSLEGFMMIV